MSKISVALATFNEERNLADCLNSVKDIAWEIVVVDGSSTDSTVAIARRFTNKVILTTNKPMFHINKQMALDAAEGDWILQLDADERVSEDLAKELVEIANKGSEFAGFWIKRKNYFLGKWLKKGGAYPDPVIRFFKRGKGHFPCKSVHEQIAIDGPVGWLQNDLIHLADPSFSRYLLRSNRYTSLEAKNFWEAHVGTNLWSILNYVFYKPLGRFLSLYIRHQAFRDGFAGFIWSFYSALHIVSSYVKYWEVKNEGRDRFDPSKDWS